MDTQGIQDIRVELGRVETAIQADYTLLTDLKRQQRELDEQFRACNGRIRSNMDRRLELYKSIMRAERKQPSPV